VEKTRLWLSRLLGQIRVRLIGKRDAWVTFTAGKGTVQLVDSPFDKALEPRKYELYILLEDWENDVYVSGVLDYEKK